MTNVIAGQMNKRKGLTQKIIFQGCFVESLTILFRSSHHISSFSSGFIHTRKEITQSSARISGCFTSTQTEIVVHYYSNREDPILTDTSFLNPKLSFDRAAIVFTDDFEFWKLKLSQERTDVTKIITVMPDIDFYKTSFTGFEVLSIIIYVDKFLDPNHDQEMFVALNLAITRAQYEVLVLVNNDYKHRVKSFFRPPTRS